MSTYKPLTPFSLTPSRPSPYFLISIAGEYAMITPEMMQEKAMDLFAKDFY
jgi:hypothetical protein